MKKDNTSIDADRVLVLEILAKIVQEFDTQEMKEAQAICILPAFLDGMDLNPFKSVSLISGSRFGKVTI